MAHHHPAPLPTLPYPCYTPLTRYELAAKSGRLQPPATVDKWPTTQLCWQRPATGRPARYHPPRPTQRSAQSSRQPPAVTQAAPPAGKLAGRGVSPAVPGVAGWEAVAPGFSRLVTRR